MGATNTDHYTNKQKSVAAMAKALGHPARVAIVEYLLKKDACICGDIVSELPLAQPTVSQHLKELKNAGLIKGEVEGTSVCYCLDEENIAKLHTYLGSMLKRLTKKACC
jgi:DNA-binding transcriptional ArsR family regulator